MFQSAPASCGTGRDWEDCDRDEVGPANDVCCRKESGKTAREFTKKVPSAGASRAVAPNPTQFIAVCC